MVPAHRLPVGWSIAHLPRDRGGGEHETTGERPGHPLTALRGDLAARPDAATLTVRGFVFAEEHNTAVALAEASASPDP